MRINIEVVFAHTKKNNLAGCLTLYSEKYFIKNLPYIILSSLAFPAALELFLGGNNTQSDYVVNVSRSFQIPFLITYDLTISLINITSLSVFFSAFNKRACTLWSIDRSPSCAAVDKF